MTAPASRGTELPPRPDVTSARLRAVPLLADLGERHLGAIALLGVLREYPRGATLFQQGDPGDSLQLIVGGAVRVFRAASDGGEMTLARLTVGDVLGELSVIDGLPRSASAVALEPAALLVIPRVAFQRWLATEQEAAPALLRTLSRRLRDADEVLADLALIPLERRLAKLLLRQSEESSDGRVHSSQSDLAATLGVTREAVNKSLRHLQQQALVLTGRATITILDRPGLDGATGGP